MVITLQANNYFTLQIQTMIFLQILYACLQISNYFHLINQFHCTIHRLVFILFYIIAHSYIGGMKLSPIKIQRTNGNYFTSNNYFTLHIQTMISKFCKHSLTLTYLHMGNYLDLINSC